ncbi:unnamed protein product [Danaus chrysippus]|uniref:(African queen) hypothetical protein n=1 Tax=Danaus chrysippus TaxID=151541 RepID=A0A8J2W0M8_9NEOP|nr:unnamed protein product [Danaus chrysippus]
MMVSMTNVNYIFVAQDVDHRCLVPKCEDLNPVVEKPHWWPNDVDVRCSQPVVDEEKYLQNDKCSNETFYKELNECHEWVYENNDSVVSVTTYLEAFPSLLFMVSAVISALLLSFTPETKNQPIFDTIKQIETYEATVHT